MSTGAEEMGYSELPQASSPAYHPGRVYGIVGGVECNRGADFRYWWVGQWVAKMV